MLLSIAYVVTISFVIRCKITSAEVGELNAVQSVGWRNSVIYKECNYTSNVGTCEALRFDSISNRTSDSGFDS